MARCYIVGECEVWPDQRRVLVSGEPVSVGARAFDLLLYLIAHRERVVGKDELLEQVWQGLVVEEGNLTVHVSALRKLLGARAIATIPGRGYRFALPVNEPTAALAAVSAAPPSPNNLPVERSSFIGRGREIVTVRGLLSEHRLVTLTGIGGSGKTRLAVQVGRQELGSFPDGVFFVDLAPVKDLEVAAQTVARACGLPSGDALGGGSGSVIERLLAMLARRRCLLLVDNCEHLLDVTADLVDRVLDGCMNVVLLATSREALGVEGEQIMQVPSLAIPADSASDEVTDALRLFVDRARAIDLTFHLDTRTHAAVAEICRRLDGIPLAIEFAAARMAHLSAPQIAERLSDRFRLLTGGRRRLHRQQTLAATLDWSHDLLRPDEQIVFRRLSIFAGAFRLEAAEAICADETLAMERVLELLGSLVSKSLLAMSHDEGGEARYRLLETVRLYASDKLGASLETDRMRSRHRDWYLGWLESMPLEDLSFAPASLKAVGNEIDNLRIAADGSIRDDRPDLLARLAVRLYGFWFEGNPNQEGRHWLEYALGDEKRLSASDRVACNAVLCAIATLEHESDVAVRYASRAIAAAAHQASPFLAMAHGLRAFNTSVLAGTRPGTATASVLQDMRRDAQTAVEMAQGALPSPWRASAELWAAGAEANVGDLRVSARWYRGCVELCYAQGRPSVLWFALAELAGAQHLLGETKAALQTALRFLTLLEPTEDLTDWQRICAIGLTPALYAGGQRERANQLLRDVAPAFRRNGVRLAVNHLLTYAAVTTHLQGDPDRAGRLLGAARHLGGAARMAISFSSPITMCMYVHYLPLVRSALGPEAAHRAREQGLVMTFDDALNYVLEGFGHVM